MLKGLTDGDFVNMISAGVFAVLIVALTTRFLMEPPAGAAASKAAPKSNPTAYERARAVSTLVDPKKGEDDAVMNFNDGRSPFGLKKNAEIWNGRIAMVR